MESNARRPDSHTVSLTFLLDHAIDLLTEARQIADDIGDSDVRGRIGAAIFNLKVLSEQAELNQQKREA